MDKLNREMTGAQMAEIMNGLREVDNLTASEFSAIYDIMMLPVEIDGNFWIIVQDYLRAAKEYRTNPAAFVKATPAVETVEPVSIEPGFYTVVFDGNDEDYVTLRVKPHWDEAEAARGVMVVGYLNGPDNARDYTNFAFASSTRVSPWKRYAGILLRQVDAARSLTDDPGAAREAYAMRSGRCSRCNRQLTVPASLHRGLGPECAKRIG